MAFQGLNPDKACLDLLLPVHNQGAEAGQPEEVHGRLVVGVGVLSEKDAVKVTPTVTRTFIPLFTSLVNRQATQPVNTQGGRRIEGEIWGRGGTETRCKQRIRWRKGIINNMNLKSLKKGEKCSAECKGRHPITQMRWGPPLPVSSMYKICIHTFSWGFCKEEIWVCTVWY